MQLLLPPTCSYRKKRLPALGIGWETQDMAAVLSSAAQATAELMLVEALKVNVAVRYTVIGCSAFWVADYLHTLPDEVKYLWPTDWSFTKVLFILIRYYTFVHTSISNWHTLGMGSLSHDQCFIFFYADTFSCFLVTMICETISYIRLWAFSGRNTPLLLFLIPYYVTIRTIEIYFLVKFGKSVDFMKAPIFDCIPIAGDSKLLSVVFITVLISQTSITLLMVYAAYRQRLLTYTGNLAKLFYRDGMLYYICLSFLTVMNIICDFAGPQNGMQYITVQFMVHSQGVIAGRLLIDLRAHSRKDFNFSMTRGTSNGQECRTKRVSKIEFAPYDSEATTKGPMNEAQTETFVLKNL
ncbi:hypothetical protein DFP72DRAFT_931144 [Ephemerocybe angulata]|uniref:DUF6533 domain-containing protein n=1 Tax=Ephemerocybe angulata TaxID=980116 RepID=A0A8H6HB90_9AGAR|nr:hypothetical protein DFP72DRAFT_931144 [Tulosesus angulatus]